MFLAWGGKKTGDQELDHNEEIEISLHEPVEVWHMLQHHEIPQSMHALTLFYGFRYLEQNAFGVPDDKPGVSNRCHSYLSVIPPSVYAKQIIKSPKH